MQKNFKEVKLPDKNLLPPTLADFGVLDFYVRYKDELHPDNDNAVFLRGVGNPNANIMFIAPSPFEEDVDMSTCDPSLMRHPSTLMFKRICLDCGINLDEEYYTTVCKYALPKSYKGKPKGVDIKYCSELLKEEIDLVKPALIVCIGRDAADFILNLRIPISKLEESYIYSEKFHTRVFVMESVCKAYYRPEHLEKLKNEIDLINRYYVSLVNNESIYTVPQNYKIIDTKRELEDWISFLKESGKKLFAVDCEWRGQTFFDGSLRSIQFCWDPGHAVFIHITDPDGNWVFDISPEELKSILGEFFNNPEIKYVGHNFNADAVWMKNHLGLDVYGKCIMDTLYAVQTFDEYADLKLEKLASKHTDLGRYDIDLILWKHKNKGIKFDEDLGYGQVPTEILFPYGCKDADATFRLYKFCFNNLIKDDTLEYYMNFRLPFVTDGFADMSETGIPFSVSDGDKLRISYLVCKHILFRIFMDNLKQEAYRLLISHLVSCYTDCLQEDELTKLITFVEDDFNSFKSRHIYDSKMNFDIDNSKEDSESNFKFEFNKCDTISGWIKSLNKILQKNKSKYYETLDFFEHYYICSRGIFNYASAPQKTKWLFTIKKLKPLTTTKVDGVVLDWDKVVEKKMEKHYRPSVDKSIIKKYAKDGDDLLLTVLQLNAVTTIVKTFLKGKDGGLQKFLCSDGRLRPSYLTTESNRPKSFKPNILNLPKEVSEEIEGGFKRVYKFLNIKEEEFPSNDLTVIPQGYNDKLFTSLVEQVKSIYKIDETIDINVLRYRSLRWCFKAPKGWAFVSADYVSAEVFAIAYLSNDKYLMNALQEPDRQFGYILDESGNEKLVRIAYIDEISKFSDKTKSLYPCFCNEFDSRLLRNDDGSLKHPKRDIYWELVENVYYMDTPREELEKRFHGKGRSVYRQSGKIANFCSGKDNFILTRDKGYVKASCIKEGDILRGIKSFTRVNKVGYLYNEPCREIVFSSGISAIYHDLHRLRCWNGHNVEWVYVKDLTSQHKVITIRGLVDCKSDVSFDNKDLYECWGLGYYIIKGECLERFLNQDDLKKYENIVVPGDIPDFIFSKWNYKQLSCFMSGAIFACGFYKSESDNKYCIRGLNKMLMSKLALICNYLGVSTYLDSSDNSALYIRSGNLNIFPDLFPSRVDWDKVLTYNSNNCDLEISDNEIDDSDLTIDESWDLSTVISSTPCVKDVVAIECGTHEYIDMSMNSHNSISYGGGANSLAKKIEIATGIPTPPEVGQKIIDAFANIRQGCWKFKTYCESLPETIGYYLSPSGFKRHFKLPPKYANMSEKEYNSLVSSLKREACNIGMQSLVADSLARATPRINKEFRDLNMSARGIVPLYDALTVFCKISEIPTVQKLMEKYMADENCWDLPGGKLKFSLDFGTTKRWDSKPTKSEIEEINQNK